MAYKKGTHFFTIPLTEEEWAEIQRRAKSQERSAANYARTILLNGKVNNKTPKAK